MLAALTQLLLFQLAGEVIAHALGLLLHPLNLCPRLPPLLRRPLPVAISPTATPVAEADCAVCPEARTETLAVSA